MTGGKLRPVAAYYVLACGDAFFFTMGAAIMIVFQTREAGLTPLQLFIVGAGWQGAILLMELPTGLIADTYGRRKSIIVGLLITGAGVILSGLYPSFWPIFFGAVIVGFGRTFVSGAQQAWIADEVGVEQSHAIYVRTAQLTMVTWVLAFPASFAIATQDQSLPMLIGGACLIVLGFFLAFTMTETGFRRADSDDLEAVKPLVQEVFGTYSAGLNLVKVRPLLITIFLIMAFYGMAGEGFQILWVAHFEDNIGFPAQLGINDPVVWLGIIRTSAAVLSVAVLEFVKRKMVSRMSSHAAVTRSLFVINALQMVGILVLGLVGSFELAMIAYAVTFALSFAYDPFYLAWINQNVDSRVRATVLSMGGQAEALGRTGGGPMIGVVGSLASVRAAITFSGLAMLLPLLLYIRALKQGPIDAPDVQDRLVQP